MTKLLASGGEFVAPGVKDFFLPPIFGEVTKPMVLLVLSIVIIGAFFLAASRNLKLIQADEPMVAFAPDARVTSPAPSAAHAPSPPPTMTGVPSRKWTFAGTAGRPPLGRAERTERSRPLS